MNEQKINQKRKKLLAIYITIVVVTAIAVITIFLLNIDFYIKTVTAIILMIIILIISLYFRPRILYYAMYGSYFKLLNSASPIKKTNQDIFSFTWIDQLKKMDFKAYKEYGGLTCYYRFILSERRKWIRKIKIAEVIILITDEQITYHSKTIDKLMKDFEEEHLKENFKKLCVVQFKMVKSFDDLERRNIEEIICHKNGSLDFVTINVGFNINSSSIYYLHSETYSPTLYYLHTVNLIKKIT